MRLPLRSLGTVSPTSPSNNLGTTNVQTLVSNAAVQYGIDPALALAVAKQESGFNQNAISPAGAIGVMQLMPATAAGLGVDPTNLNQNISGGVSLLASLLRQYDGNTALALAAYNAGPGAVATYGGVPPYAETQNYVTSIMAQLPTSSDIPTVTSTEAGVSGGSVPLAAGSDVSSDAGFDVGGGIDLTDPATLLVLAAAGGLAWWLFSS